MPCRHSPLFRRTHPKSRHPTHYGWDGDRLVCTQSDSAKVHTVYEPGSFVPLLRISQAMDADSPKTEAQATEANARGLLALASKHGKPEKSANPDDKAKEPIKLPGFGTAQWAALSKSFAHLAEKGYPEHIKTVLRQGGLDPDNITAMAKAAVEQQKAEQTAKLTIQMYHCNHLGTPIALINTQGMIDWAVELDPWGNVLNEFNPKNIDQPIRMQGQQIDRESGLFYNRHRYYDPNMGRYITQDPIGLLGGKNSYEYAYNQPTRYIDPPGLWATEAHNYFIDQTFSNTPSAIRDIIKEGSAYADKFEFQGADSAHMHAMTSDSMDAKTSQKKMCEFIKNKMSDAKDAESKGSGNYWFLLGMALHPVMDSTSPAHEGFQKWHGIVADGNKHGDSPGTLEGISTAKKPANKQRTVDKMKAVLSGDLTSCGC
jgi:RHS repeat-associated protein